MATYNNTKKTYYTIARGKFKRYEGDGQIAEFTGIDGILQDIVERKRAINGEEKVFTDFHFVDGTDNFVVSCEKFGANSNTIVRCLANIKDFSHKILLEVWQTTKNDKTYTNISVKQDGQRIQWCDIPPVETFQIETGETVKSTKKREAFLAQIIADVKARLAGSDTQVPAEMDPEPQEDGKNEDIPPYIPREY